MTLKAEDLKVGDVVRMDLKVVFADSRTAVKLADGVDRGWWVNERTLAACNAEKVVRARPVRKGDQIIWSGNSAAYTFLVVLNGERWAASNGSGQAWAIEDSDSYTWTHADGSPIDWEASE